MSSSSNSVAEDRAGGDDSNLWRVIDRDNVHGLNLAVPEDAKEVIKPWDKREDTAKFADSNVDDQVIIHVPFSQNVRLRSVLLKLGRGESAPNRLQIYANHPNIVDFTEAETTTAHLDISLLQGESTVVEYPLKVAAFASINSVSLFFSESVGGDLSRIYYIGFKGDIRELKKDKNTPMDVPAANAADALLFDRLQDKASGQQTTAR
ncbi:galactose-binding domain-like protein [Rhodocollybia butyracea]|uniref:Galactose-binding domain-like protein n=1 Tax=Rhodocollybia butyracea TaxID=206335 RepID=A0A9P5Q9K4_9AGAR|nr:galactose-binding domain-like protein [Rhodocollybia butyracea]